MPLATKLAMPSSTPSAGFFGVLATFSTESSPVVVSSRTRSVWVPPPPTPSRSRAVLMLRDSHLRSLLAKAATKPRRTRILCTLRACSIMTASTVALEHVAGDDHFHDLARTLGNAEAALLAPDLLKREIGGERNAAVNLHARIGGFERHFVSVIFGHV